jgi:hypothetical protein
MSSKVVFLTPNFDIVVAVASMSFSLVTLGCLAISPAPAERLTN